MWWQRGLLAVLLGGCTAIAPFGRFATGDAGADAGPPDDAGTGGMKRVFLSSMRYGGDLSGVAGADARCSALAGAQGLGSRYVAWIGVPGNSPADRFDRTAGPYVRVDGSLVAADWADLTNGVLANLIEMDEHGDIVSDGGLTWTGVTHEGVPTEDGANCEGWTAGFFEPVGAVGAYDNTELGEWSHYDNFGPWPCSNYFHLYCFEQ
ncbi:MAG: hypothetical protein H6719_15485 [Sandaracinaceae bacterium]|nr:hypothetical protein [Sandaracinaceae bacterium]